MSWKLIREIELSGMAADDIVASFDPEDWPPAAEAIGNENTIVPGQIDLPAGACGFDWLVCFVDVDGARVISSTATFSYKIFEKVRDAVGNDADAAQLFVGAAPTETDGVAQHPKQWRPDSKGQVLTSRIYTVALASTFTGLPGGTETHAQIWACPA